MAFSQDSFWRDWVGHRVTVEIAYPEGVFSSEGLLREIDEYGVFLHQEQTLHVRGAGEADITRKRMAFYPWHAILTVRPDNPELGMEAREEENGEEETDARSLGTD